MQNIEVRKDVQVAFRVDRDLKERADTLFDRLGMNMSTALNVFLRKAVEESAIPFSVSTGFAFGLSSDEITNIFEDAVRKEIDAKQRKGLPVARYDAANKQAYLEHADGTQEYINE